MFERMIEHTVSRHPSKPLFSKNAFGLINQLKQKTEQVTQTFVVSRRWFEKINKLHISHCNLRRESSSTNNQAGLEFPANLKDIVESKHLSNIVINAYECGLV